MAMNCVQFQPGLSMVEFMQQYGTHKFRSSRPEFWSAGWRKPVNSRTWLAVDACFV